ncbi:MAG: cytochrome c [Archangium sp.]|nr:cytochrome c [Archangium sp.]
MRSTVVLAALVAVNAFAEDSVFPSKQELQMARMLEPQNVSGEAKAFLKSKMKAHNKDMRDLVLAVATLKYDDAKKFAQGISNAPRLDKAAGATVSLPDSFFVLQDALKKHATEVVTACDAKKPGELNVAFTSMMATCMSCHNAFLVPMRGEKSAAPAK